MSYGAIDYLVDPTAPRYTSMDAVKKALNINDTSLDDDILAAINAAELQIDQFNEHSFPDDSLTEPIHGNEIDGIPEPIRLWALSASIGTLKLRDQVYGSSGSDDWLGAVDVGEQVRRSLGRNPMARGFKVAWGVA